MINRVDDNGVMHPFTQRQPPLYSNGKEDVVGETYAQAPNQPAGQRTRSEPTFVKMKDGVEQRIHELERVNPVPNGQLRVVERTVETVRSVGPVSGKPTGKCSL